MMQNWNNLPQEMQDLPQWVLAGKKKEPLLVSANGQTYNASPTKGPWLTFADAVSLANKCGHGIGFILTASDPFTCIDLDIKDSTNLDSKGELIDPLEYTSNTTLKTYSGFINYVDSYTELSSSGKGIHIWCKASLPAGRRQGGIEVYSNERFIACTGNSVKAVEYYKILDRVYPNNTYGVKPVVEAQRQVEQIVSTFKGHVGTLVPLVEVEPVLSDDDVWDRITNSANGEKFERLVAGDWDVMENGYGELLYKSHSQADAAMFEFLCFHTPSNAQAVRLFHKTALGVREKAFRGDYLIRTIRVSRTRMAEEELFKETERLAGELLAQRLIARHKEHKQAQLEKEIDIELFKADEIVIKTNPLFSGFNEYMHKKHTKAHPTILNAVSALNATPIGASIREQGPYPYEGMVNDQFYVKPEVSWPPGLIGDLAKFIYRASHKPVREIAICAALGFMAGICGQTYKFSGKGLNMYLLLLADSGTGKDIIHTGIQLILSQTAEALSNHVDSSNYASPPALIKSFTDDHSCYVNLIPELGVKIRTIAEGRNEPMRALGEMWTLIFEQTSAESKINKLKYSKKENDTADVTGFAYSILGESTPENFYDCITNDMLSGGFMSRMTMVEYKGKTVPSNQNKIKAMEPILINRVNDLGLIVNDRLRDNIYVNVQSCPEVVQLYLKMDKHCDYQINMAPSQALKSIHNREASKIMRIASLLAVAENPLVPEIKVEHFNWALEMMNLQTKSMVNKIKSGAVGEGDGMCEEVILQYCQDYIVGERPLNKSSNDYQMQREGIIPRKWLSGAVTKIKCFRKSPRGVTVSFKTAISTLIDNGVIGVVDKKELKDKYQSPGTCYRLLNVD